jgi:hypothetical protein
VNKIHQLLMYTDNLLYENISIINKYTVALLDASKEVGLEENFKYMYMSRHQTT